MKQPLPYSKAKIAAILVTGIQLLSANMAFAKQPTPLLITNKVSNSYSLGNPFNQFQISQGLSSSVSISSSTAIQPRAFVNSQLMWNTRTIPVCWTNLDPNRATERGWVKNAVSKWITASGNQLNLTGWGLCTSGNPFGIKISNENVRANSQIGTNSNKINPSMQINFFATTPPPSGYNSCVASESARQSCIEFSAVHEFGHALGFQHEQDSPLVTDACIGYLENNNLSAPQPWLGDLTLTNQWDANSVMNYCNPLVRNGDLSRLDQMAAKTWYGNISNYSTWNNTLNIPVIDVNGIKMSATLVFNGSTFVITSSSTTTPNSASEAVFSNNMIHIPMLRFQDQQNSPNFVTDLYDVWLSYNSANGQLTLTSVNTIR